MKSLVWFLNLSLNGVSEAWRYLLLSLLVLLETFASYTILGVRHLLSKGHSFRTLQFHPKYSLLGFKIYLLCDNITDCMFIIQQQLILTVLRLNILCIGCRFGKWRCFIHIRFYVHWKRWVKPYYFAFTFFFFNFILSLLFCWIIW